MFAACAGFFNNHSDTRVRLEAEAVLAILKRCSLDWELVTSSAALYEIGLISDPGKRSQALRLIQRARETIRVDDILLSRAEEFENPGVMGRDAVHIACTEKSGAVLLTIDDDLVKIMKKNILRISIRADNPLHWLMEMNQHGE
ncbi:MAG: hypothetical protein WC379_17095 [Methanoregula sp.]|jgi:predicted nucleic acid-binding protein